MKNNAIEMERHGTLKNNCMCKLISITIKTKMIDSMNSICVSHYFMSFYRELLPFTKHRKLQMQKSEISAMNVCFFALSLFDIFHR